MNKLIKLVYSYQQCINDDTFGEIVEILNPIIKHQINNIPLFDQEDVYQEILMKISERIFKFDLINYPTSNQYIDNFKTKYKIIKEEFDNEYRLFCLENQFIKYIIKICKSCISEYYRQNMHKTISLDQKVYEYIELPDTVCKFNKTGNFDYFKLTKDDQYLLDLLINKKYTQKEIGQVLGISQQAVSKKIKKIKKILKSGC